MFSCYFQIFAVTVEQNHNNNRPLLLEQSSLFQKCQDLSASFCLAIIVCKSDHEKSKLQFSVCEHNVMHESDLVIEWTLRQQFPSLAKQGECDCKQSGIKENLNLVKM